MGVSERGHQVVIVKRMNGKPLPSNVGPPSDGAEEEERESADWPIWETPTIDS